MSSYDSLRLLDPSPISPTADSDESVLGRRVDAPLKAHFNNTESYNENPEKQSRLTPATSRNFSPMMSA